MASNGKWEVVGKGGKKKAPNEGKKNKVKASDMPKAEINSKSANAGLFKVFYWTKAGLRVSWRHVYKFEQRAKKSLWKQ